VYSHVTVGALQLARDSIAIDSCASQLVMPAAPLDLNLLNKSSARLATFVVRIFKGRCAAYTYNQKGTGTSVTAHKFEAWLVGLKCENYCVGFVRGPAATCEAAAKKFTDGSCWLLSKVSLDTHTTSAFIYTPVAVRVDLRKSTAENAGTLSGVPQPAVHPVPPRTVADAGRINTNKCTDLLALVKSVSRERTSKTSVPIADVVLVDDSKVDGDAFAAITVGVFGGAKIVILK